MNDQKLREEFETWASSPDFGLRAGHFVKGDDGEYLNYPTQCYWQVWQASRAALVVELPQEEPGYMYYAPDILEAIEVAGVRVK